MPFGKQKMLPCFSCECTYQSWPEGRRHLLLLHGVPVGAAEEIVHSDVSLHSQALLRLPHKQLQHKHTRHRHIQSLQLLLNSNHGGKTSAGCCWIPGDI